MFYRGVFPPPIPCSSHLTLLTWEVKVIRSAQKMCKNLVTPCKIAKLSPVSSDANILELSFQWAWELVLWCHSGHPVAASAVSEEKRSRTRKLYQQSSWLHLQSENKSGDVLRRSWPSDLQTGNCQIVSLYPDTAMERQHCTRQYSGLNEEHTHEWRVKNSYLCHNWQSQWQMLRFLNFLKNLFHIVMIAIYKPWDTQYRTAELTWSPFVRVTSCLSVECDHQSLRMTNGLMAE